MQIDEEISGLLEEGSGYRIIVDERATLAFYRDFAPGDHFFLPFDLVSGKKEFQLLIPRNGETSFHNCLLSTFAHSFGVRTFAENETQCIDNDRLAGARLPRNDIEASLESNLEFLDQRIILY